MDLVELEVIHQSLIEVCLMKVLSCFAFDALVILAIIKSHVYSTQVILDKTMQCSALCINEHPKTNVITIILCSLKWRKNRIAGKCRGDDVTGKSNGENNDCSLTSVGLTHHNYNSEVVNMLLHLQKCCGTYRRFLPFC